MQNEQFPERVSTNGMYDKYCSFDMEHAMLRHCESFKKVKGDRVEKMAAYALSRAKSDRMGALYPGAPTISNEDYNSPGIVYFVISLGKKSETVETDAVGVIDRHNNGRKFLSNALEQLSIKCASFCITGDENWRPLINLDLLQVNFWSRAVVSCIDNTPIKIGTTKRGAFRINDLQVGSPDKLHCIHYIYGGVKEERLMHNIFNQSHIRGEWFRPEVVLDYIYYSTIDSFSRGVRRDHVALEHGI